MLRRTLENLPSALSRISTVLKAEVALTQHLLTQTTAAASVPHTPHTPSGVHSLQQQLSTTTTTTTSPQATYSLAQACAPTSLQGRCFSSIAPQPSPSSSPLPPPPAPSPTTYDDPILTSIQSAPTLQHLEQAINTLRDTLAPTHVAHALRMVHSFSRNLSQSDPLLRNTLDALLARLAESLPDFSVADLALVVFHLGQLRERPDPETGDKIIEALKGQLHTLQAGRPVVEVLWALRWLGLTDSVVMREGRDLVLERLHQLDAKHLAMAANTLATAGMYDWATFNLITRAALDRLPDFNEAQFSALVTAFARAGHIDEGFFDCIAEAAARRIDGFLPTHVSQMVNAFSRLRYRNPRFFSLAAMRGQQMMHRFSPKDVAMTAHAFAVQKLYDATLYDSLCARALQVLPSMQPRHLSILAWSLAKQKHSNDVLLASLAQTAVRQVRHFLPQNLTNMVYAFAALGVYQKELFEAVAEECKGRMQGAVERLRKEREGEGEGAEGDAQREFAREMELRRRAAETSGEFRGSLEAAVDSEGAASLFASHHLAELARAMATVGHKDEELMGLIARLAVDRLKDCTPASLGDLSWAYGQLEVHDAALFDALSFEGVRRLPSFEPSTFTDLLWGFAVTGHESPQLMEAAEAAVGEIVDRLRKAVGGHQGQVEALARLVWCFDALGLHSEMLMQAFKDAMPQEQSQGEGEGQVEGQKS